MSLDVYLRVRYGKVLFRANITHNLTKMAGEAGLYDAIWRPYRLKEGYVKTDNYEDEMKFEDSQTVIANELIDLLKDGLRRLEESPDKYKEFNPTNGWGSYETFVRFVEQYLRACIRYSDAIVRVSR